MFRTKITAGVAAFAVSLVSTVAAVESSDALARDVTAPTAEIAHEHASATEEVVPRFVSKEVVQAVTEADAKPAADAGSLGELVADIDTAQELDEQMRCLAGAVYFEARGEPLAGQLAVAEVIVNRAASGSFPASYCGVVLQPSQFSFVRHGRIPTIRTGSAAWRRAKAIAQIAHQGLWDSKAEGSLYFHARSVSPDWSNRHQAMATISHHVFYK